MCEFQEKRNRKEFEQERQDKIEPKQTIYHGEFDPGSGRTLAACLIHASRTLKRGACSSWMSCERVSNA